MRAALRPRMHLAIKESLKPAHALRANVTPPMGRRPATPGLSGKH